MRGKKPASIPPNKTPTQREWKSQSKPTPEKNPISEGQKYSDFLASDDTRTYSDVAREFHVSKARVSQMVALVKKLPQEILDFLENQTQEEQTKFFTERRLRPLTTLKSDEEKIARFKKLRALHEQRN